jgi:hypothetical protein
MLPLKCFNYGGIGHFYCKCPHMNKDNDEEEVYKRENKYQNGKNRRNKKKYQKGNERRNENKFLKKSFYSKEDSSSSDEENNDSDNDLERVLFMVVEDDSREEGEVDHRE